MLGSRGVSHMGQPLTHPQLYTVAHLTLVAAENTGTVINCRKRDLLTLRSAPGFRRPLRGIRLPLSRRRKKPAGEPRRNRLVVSNSKNCVSGSGLLRSNGGGTLGCLESTSKDMTLPREWAMRWTLPSRMKCGLLRHHNRYTRFASATSAEIIFGLWCDI